MKRPHTNEGGFEIEDVCPDVTAAAGIITPSQAWHAARTAIRYFDFVGKYPYVNQVDSYSRNEGIVSVGVWSPLEYNPDNTIISNDLEVSRSRSFVAAAKALCRFAGTSIDEIHRVNVMILADGAEIEFHADKYDGARSILQLMGYRSLGFIHSKSAIAAQTDAFLFPGDAYRMQFTEDDTSVQHAITYIGHGPRLPNVGLYINA